MNHSRYQGVEVLGGEGELLAGEKGAHVFDVYGWALKVVVFDVGVVAAGVGDSGGRAVVGLGMFVGPDADEEGGFGGLGGNLGGRKEAEAGEEKASEPMSHERTWGWFVLGGCDQTVMDVGRGVKLGGGFCGGAA